MGAVLRRVTSAARRCPSKGSDSDDEAMPHRIGAPRDGYAIAHDKVDNDNIATILRRQPGGMHLEG